MHEIAMYVCICNAVTDREIRQAVKLGAASMCDLREGLGVGSNCGKCTSCAKGILREELACERGDAMFAAQPA